MHPPELEQARDIYGDPAWKAAGALLLARRGETEEAVGLAREAIASMADSDNITAHAEILADFAEVLRAHGDLVGAAEALAAAAGLRGEGQRPARQALPRTSGGNRNRRAGSDDEVTVSREAASRLRAPAGDRPGGHGPSGSVKSRVDARPPPTERLGAPPARRRDIVAAMDEVTVERLVAEQRRYYRERAPEYDDWWFRRAGYTLDAETEARWFADVRQLEAALEAFVPRGDVLELAAGTGIWTGPLLRHADP